MAHEPYKGAGSIEMEQYNGIGYNEYQGMEVNQYPGNRSEDASDRDVFQQTRVYDEDLRSRLHRDLKTRQIAMIALGGALGTGLLINT
jgi:amino acid transporter